ncbi:hypothetical protein NNJEOMEG_03956 [Fundidesulfovibrio magnetotacticus]|uniref:Uncharacterized protein n=1 Tax=Fundidesulfovibrio magnetotacticus TaxID=2730080 RepID=A0A6V8LUE1_9BACT|nr:hypothetical protein [Fundidesulfovibrio magnetotacticus]GFK96082.1 hypothetical protein NNJEOMEG_03956 [Fundidesulfovibrio magnetotacticus]
MNANSATPNALTASIEMLVALAASLAIQVVGYTFCLTTLGA